MPDRRDHDHDTELSRFWNELSETGEIAPTSLDPETAALIRRLHVSANAPLPGSARERVWRGLLDRYDDPVTGKEPNMHTVTNVIRPGLNGQAIPMRPRPPTDYLPRPADHRLLLVAAVLVVAIIGGIAGAIIADRLDSNGPRPAPAILAPGTPSPDTGITDETIAEVSLPADLLPPGESVTAGMTIATVPVGTSQQPAEEAIRNPGVQASYILDGTVSVVSDEQMHLIEPGGTGTMEAVEAGTEVVLEPGDTLVTRKSRGEVWTNDGPAEVQMIVMEVYGGQAATSFWPLGWTSGGVYDYDELTMPADQPALLRLRRVTAPTDTVLPLPPEALAQFARLESDETGSSLGQQSDGSVKFISGDDKPVTAYIMTVELAGDGPGTPAAGVSTPASPTP